MAPNTISQVFKGTASVGEVRNYIAINVTDKGFTVDDMTWSLGNKTGNFELNVAYHLGLTTKLGTLFIKTEPKRPQCPNKCGEMGVARDFKNQFVCQKCGTVIVRPPKEQLKTYPIEKQTAQDPTPSREHTPKGWPVV